jgi:hypothetical protein
MDGALPVRDAWGNPTNLLIITTKMIILTTSAHHAYYADDLDHFTTTAGLLDYCNEEIQEWTITFHRGCDCGRIWSR